MRGSTTMAMPNTMRMIPATRLSTSRSRASERPISPALAPNSANMTANPMTKAAVGRRTPFHRCSTWSAGTPEMNDRYPGTSASTHGEANETKPAAKATARDTTES